MRVERLSQKTVRSPIERSFATVPRSMTLESNEMMMSGATIASSTLR